VLKEFKEFTLRGNVVDMAVGIIVAFVMFLLIRGINRMQKEEETPPAEPTTKECPYCLSTIPIKASRCAHCTSELP